MSCLKRAEPVIKSAIVALVLLLAFGAITKGQTDTEFWFAAPEVSTATQNYDKPIVLYFTTTNLPATVTVSQPANPSFSPITLNVPINSTASVDLTSFIGNIENTTANSVLNYGLYITSNEKITAYYEVVSSYCNCNPEIFVLKGRNALGDSFMIPSQTYYQNGPYSPLPFSSFDIVATENGTEVTITPSNGIVGHVAGSTFIVNLNKGQTWSGTATSQMPSGHLQGSVVTSNKPIAITIKDDLIGYPYYGWDLAGDQIVPISVIGKEYIVVKGGLNYGTLYMERVSVLSTQNNTEIFIDGAGTPAVILGLGQTYEFVLTNPSTYIRSTNPVYVLHTSGNGIEIGQALIPPITCTGSEQIGFTRSSSMPFYLSLAVRTSSVGFFELNGNTNLITSAAFQFVPGTGGQWSFSRLLIDAATVPVGQGSTIRLTNGDYFMMGILNGADIDGCRYGYFSNFNSLIADAGSDDTICMGETVNLNATGGSMFLWTPDSSLSDAHISDPVAMPLTTTTYLLHTSNESGCSASDSVTIYVNDSTTINLCSSDTSVCPGSSIVLCASGTQNYIWSPPYGLSSVSDSQVTATPQLTTVYTVVGNNGLCSDTAQIKVGIYDIPELTVASSSYESCSPLCTQFTYTVLPPGTDSIFKWNFGIDQFYGIDNTVVPNPEICFYNPGGYRVALKMIFTNGCEDSSFATVRVHPDPVAEFTSVPQMVYVSDPQVRFYDQSVGAVEWIWNFGDPGGLPDNYSMLQNPVHYFSDEGTYHVVLTVKSPYGCIDSTSDNITIRPELSVFIPNAFTPDEDGKNEYFFPVINGMKIESFLMEIFSRWGECIYKSTSINQAWDGTYKGEIVPPGVYVYKITFKGDSDIEHRYVNHVSVIR